MSLRSAFAAGIGILVVTTTPAPGQEPTRTGRLAAPPATAASGYLKIGDIKGESVDEGHKDWINLLSVSNSITRPMGAGAGNAPAAPGRAAGPGSFKVRKAYDRSSPRLAQACAEGTRFDQVVLEAPSNEGTAMKFELENVRITSYSLDASGERPMEEISFTYMRIETSR